MNVPIQVLGVDPTEGRLWFLYCYVARIKAEIEAVTGWSRGLIDACLRRWNLTQFSETDIETTSLIRRALANRHGIPLLFGIPLTDEDCNATWAAVSRFRDELGKNVLSGEITWQMIDDFADSFYAEIRKQREIRCAWTPAARR